jgi:hypothetical protein
VDTIKISRNHYRLTNLHCIISSKYLVSNFASIPYTKITKFEILVRPWQDWFGLATVRIAEKNVSPIENWSGEDYIRLVSKSDAQIIVSILQQHIKIKKN